MQGWKICIEAKRSLMPLLENIVADVIQSADEPIHRNIESYIESGEWDKMLNDIARVAADSMLDEADRISGI